MTKTLATLAAAALGGLLIAGSALAQADTGAMKSDDHMTAGAMKSDDHMSAGAMTSADHMSTGAMSAKAKPMAHKMSAKKKAAMAKAKADGEMSSDAMAPAKH
jgi:hypothetical protein